MNRARAKAIIDTIVAIRGGFTDEQAITYPDIFPEFKTGASYNVDDRVLYEGKVYKVRQAHTSQADWVPSAVPALFQLLNVTESGTIDNPIPWESGLVAENGKYYTENGKLYLCNRDSGNPLYYAISALIGLYFVAVD